MAKKDNAVKRGEVERGDEKNDLEMKVVIKTGSRGEVLPRWKVLRR